jgi:hypothetical protein
MLVVVVLTTMWDGSRTPKHMLQLMECTHHCDRQERLHLQPRLHF